MKEILLQSYWEHFSAENDLARYLSPEDKRRVKLRQAANEIQEKLEVIEELEKIKL